MPPFIGTLGMYGVARGAAYLIAGGMTVPVDNEWYRAGSATAAIYGIPILVDRRRGRVIWSCTTCSSQTRFGQHTYALGASRDAAVRAGINVRRPDA